jgi:phosphoglycolate phosphatase
LKPISVNSKFSSIIWDWNGTLLNDLDICLESINQLLSNRNLEQLNHDKYLEVFDFPIIEYYQRIGFDFKKEPFEIPANQFIELYFSKLKKANLHTNVEKVLQTFKQKNISQYILSAAEEINLKHALEYYKIAHYFDDVAGLAHHYAYSKIDVGKDLIARKSINPSISCLIGDTLHDYEVAQALGLQCVLIANGHQPYEKLKTVGVPVYLSLEEMAQNI